MTGKKTTARSTKWHEDKARATKSAVIEGASSVFEQAGYRSAVISSISKAAATTAGAMYHYFPSKEAIALGVLEEFQRRWEAIPASAPEDSPLGILIARTLGQMRLLTTDTVVRAGFRLTFDTGTLPTPNKGFPRAWMSATEKSLENAIAAGELVPGTDAQTIAWNMLTGFLGSYALVETLDTGKPLLDHLEGVLAGAVRSDLAPEHRDRVLTAMRYSFAAGALGS